MEGTRRVTMVTSSYPTVDHPYHAPFVADLAERVAGRGWDVHVVALVPPDSPPAERPGVTTTGVPSPFWRGAGRDHRGGIPALLRRHPTAVLGVPRALRDLRRAVLAVGDRTDIVHAHWIPTRLSAVGAGIPIVTTAHGADVRLLERLPAMAARVAGPGPLLVGTAELERRLATIAPTAAIRRIPPVGIETRATQPQAALPRRAVAIMRLAQEKGVDDLAAAWRIVMDALPTAELIVIGDGPMHESLRMPGVRLVGNIAPERVPEEIHRASLAIQASRHEPFGVATVEALVHGRPVVATRTGIAAEIVSPDVGRLVPVGDVPALAHAIIELLSDDDAMARMGRAAAERMTTRFQWDGVLDALLDAYTQAIDAHRGH